MNAFNVLLGSFRIAWYWPCGLSLLNCLVVDILVDNHVADVGAGIPETPLGDRVIGIALKAIPIVVVVEAHAKRSATARHLTSVHVLESDAAVASEASNPVLVAPGVVAVVAPAAAAAPCAEADVGAGATGGVTAHTNLHNLDACARLCRDSPG